MCSWRGVPVVAAIVLDKIVALGSPECRGGAILMVSRGYLFSGARKSRDGRCDVAIGNDPTLTVVERNVDAEPHPIMIFGLY